MMFINEKDIESGTQRSRRRLLATAWVAPVVTSVSLPVHAETSSTDPTSTEPPAAVCGVACVAGADFTVTPIVTIYRGGEFPKSDIAAIPQGSIGWNSGMIVESAIGCDMSDYDVAFAINGNTNFPGQAQPGGGATFDESAGCDVSPQGICNSNRHNNATGGVEIIATITPISPANCTPVVLSLDFGGDIYGAVTQTQANARAYGHIDPLNPGVGLNFAFTVGGGAALVGPSTQTEAP